MDHDRVIGRGIWQAPAPTSEEPYLDPAEPILQRDSAVDEVKSSAWDAFHSSPTPENLIESLKSIPVSDDTKRSLVQAKQLTAPVPDATDKVISAIQTLARIPGSALALAEKHPQVAKAFIDASTKT